MQAIVLCAGYGTRLGLLSKRIPKPLLPVLDRPILVNTIYYLKRHGVTNVGINTHHLASQVEGFVGDGRRFRLPIFTNREKKILGTGGGVAGLRNFVSDDNFIIYNSDIVTNISPDEPLRLHLDRNPVMTLILHDHARFNKFVLAEDFRITDMEDRSGQVQAANNQLAFTGFAIANKRIFDYLPEGEFKDMRDVYLELIEKGELIGYQVKGRYWQDIGTLNDYLLLHRDVLVNHIPVMQDFELPDGSIFTGRNALVSDQARLRGFVSIGHDCRIEDAEIENCVILSKTLVRGGEKLKDSVVGPDFVLKA